MMVATGFDYLFLAMNSQQRKQNNFGLKIKYVCASHDLIINSTTAIMHSKDKGWEEIKSTHILREEN